MMPVFANPVYLWMLLALVPLLLLRFRAHRLSRRGTPGLVADRLRNELIIGSTPWLRWLAFSLQALALTFIVVALARPQWGYEKVATESEGRNIIIAVDTSRSMLANDLLPDRLTRAKLAAQDLVDSLPGDRIGLIAFAGRAFLQAPLTMDHMAIVETLNQLDTEIIPRGGTNINSAVAMAIETFQKADSKDNALILFSDGEDLEGGEDLAKIGKDAENLGLIIIAVGVGTEAGSIIPDPDSPSPGVFIKNDDGNIVRSRLDPAALRQLSASTSRGLYLNLGAANSITDIVSRALEQIEASRHEDAVRKRPIERFAWALSAALAFMIIGFLLPVSLRGKRQRSSLPSPTVAAASKATLILLPGLFILCPPPAQAETPPTETLDMPALEAFQNKDYATAVNRYKQEIEETKSPSRESWLHFGLGSAAYRTGDFELAEQSFGKVLERQNRRKLNADAHYNLGNTLFRHGQALLKSSAASQKKLLQRASNSGPGKLNSTPAPAKFSQADLEGAARQWEAAIEHYQAALGVEPGHAPSNENLNIVRKHLERLQEKQKEQEQQKKEDEQKKDKKDDKEENKEQDKDKNQDPNRDQNQNDKDQNQNPDGSKGDQPPSEDQKNNDGNDKNKQAPPSSDPKNPNDQNKQPNKPRNQPDKPKNSQKNDPKNKPGDKQQPQKQGKPEPHQKEPEGNLKADPSSRQPAQPAKNREAKKDQQRNPETGFSPLEARRLLQSLSDEDLTVKPLIRPMPAQPYKNW